MLNTASFRDFVGNFTVLWNKSLDSVRNNARESGMFRVGLWGKGVGDTKQYSEVDTEEYASKKAEGSAADQLLIQQGYTKTVSPVRFGVQLDITWEMREYNKYNEVLSKITSLATQCPNRLDLDLTHRFTFGTATSYTNKDGDSVDISVGDTLALFSTAHTLRGSATTYRNRLANNPQFSEGALEGMELLGASDTYNQLGEKVGSIMDYDILWYGDHPTTEKAILRQLRSTAQVGAPNSGVVNVDQGRYRPVMLPRLATTAAGAYDSTKAKYWGIASSRLSSAYLDMVEENTLTAPSPNSNAEDFSTDNWSFKARMARAITIVGGNWIKFSDGLGTA